MSEKGNLRPGWKPGQSGNPNGRKPGTRNKSTLLAISILEKDIEAVTKTVTKAAKGGDLMACRMVLERLVPPIKERPVKIELPNTSTPEGISEAQRRILESVAAGELLPSEGEAMAAIVEQHRKALETEELEKRIAELERKQS